MTLIDTIIFKFFLLIGHYALLLFPAGLLLIHSPALFRVLPGLLLVCANLNVSNQLEIFGLVFLGGAPCVVFASIAIFLIQENEGVIQALNSVATATLMAAFFLVFSEFHLAYIPSPNDSMHQFFDTLFNINAWVTLSSVFAFLSSHMIGIMLFWLIREKSKLPTGFTIFVVTSLTHVIDTIAFRVLLGGINVLEVPFLSSFLYEILDMLTLKITIAFVTGMLISAYVFFFRGRA